MVLFPFLVTCGHCVGSHKFIFQDLFPYLVSAAFSCILIMFIFVFWLLDMVAAGDTWLYNLHDFTLIYSIQGGQKVAERWLGGD